MKLKLSGGEIIHVVFTKIPRKQKKKTYIDTRCMITIPSGVRYIGFAQQHENDIYNPITGKKISLARTLEKAYGLKQEKSIRIEIWNWFVKQFENCHNSTIETIKRSLTSIQEKA